MSVQMSDEDVLFFAFAGCNAAEIAAYAGIEEATAQARLDRVLYQHAHPEIA